MVHLPVCACASGCKCVCVCVGVSTCTCVHSERCLCIDSVSQVVAMVVLIADINALVFVLDTNIVHSELALSL